MTLLAEPQGAQNTDKKQQQPKRSGNILSSLVHMGVGLFGDNQLKDADPLFLQLQHNANLANSLGLPHRSWPELITYIAEHPQELHFPPPLAKLVIDFKLNLADIFLLALCGEVENSYSLNLALIQLQHPDNNPRPSLHLTTHLLRELFGYSTTPANMASHALIRQGILHITGDTPLPMRHFSMTPHIWQLLNGINEQWPETKKLSTQDSALIPQNLHKELPQLIQILRTRDAQGVVLRGTESNAHIVAHEIALHLGLTPILIETKAWRSDTLLHIAARYANWLPIIHLQLGPADRFHMQHQHQNPVIFITGREGAVEIDGLIELELPATPLTQRKQLWQHYLGAEDIITDELAQSAMLDGATIRDLTKAAKLDAQRQNQTLNQQHIITARRRQGGNQLRQLAQPVNRTVERDALILPEKIEQQFNQLIQRCTFRESLWQGLGVTAKASSNYGVRALFSGESGTGKTLAASYLATRLGAPLYRLDLASVMNKYIGETEKNLGLLLDEAAASDTILLLDEADALFGKRTEGDSAGDRFANMLTNFLLTRIENHNGIVILTSNNRARIDSAFTRRLDTVLDFPAPNAKERYLIWLSHLGERAPAKEQCQLLASYCELPGGFIRNAVLNAAAVESENTTQPLTINTLLNSLCEEYRKLGRAIPPNIEQLRGSHG